MEQINNKANMSQTKLSQFPVWQHYKKEDWFRVDK